MNNIVPRLILSIILLIPGFVLLRIGGPLGSDPVVSLLGFTFAFGGMFIWVPLINKLPGKFTIILVIALGLRLLFIGYPPSDDYNRYAWEGKIQTHGFNPYKVPPDDPSLENLRDEIWKGINHPDIPAAYPPGAMFVFKIFSVFYPSPEFFRLFLILFEIITIVVLIKIFRLKKWDLGPITLYAFNPFVVLFYIGECHLDVIQTTFCILTLFFYLNNRFGLAFFFLGTAFVWKYVAIIFLPLLLQVKSWKHSFYFLIPLLSFFMYWESDVNLFLGLSEFTSQYTFNAPIYFTFNNLFNGSAKLLCLIGFVSFASMHLLINHNREDNFFTIGILLLLFSPTVHPWYLCLFLPFMLLTKHRNLLFLMGIHFVVLLPLYTRNIQTGLWAEYAWSKWIIWVPFYASLFISLPIFRKKENQMESQKPIGISIVIPTLNEESRIIETLDSLKTNLMQKDYEIIVVDGGSTDKTIDLIKKKGLKIITSTKKGRGYQLFEGLKNASKTFTLFLHADCHLSKSLINSLYEKLKLNPNSVGGWHNMKYQNHYLKRLKIIQGLNNFRARFLGIAFGDQAIFVNTQLALKNELIKPMPLMEDVYTSLKIKSQGCPLILREPVIVSSRKWKNISFSFNSFLIIKLVLIFLIQNRWKIFKPENPYFIRQYYR